MKVSLIFLDSSAVEHSAVNRRVVGSNPTRGAKTCKYNTYRFFCIIRIAFPIIQKNRLLIMRRRDIPRYHFFSFCPHGPEPHRVPSTLFRCNGRIPLSAKFLTCLPLFTLTAPKPSSACSNPPLSA